MTDREKIIEIIKKNGTYNGRSLSFDYYVIQPDDLADALIEAGYGDVKEWKRRAEVAEKKLLELAMFCTKGNPYLSKEHSQEKEAYKLFNDWLQQAAREIEKEEQK